MAAAPWFVELGDALGAKWPLEVAHWVTTRPGQFTFYLAYIVLGAILVGCGMRAYARFQRWSFWIGCLGLVTFIAVLLPTSHTEFVRLYNHWMAKRVGWGGGNAYQRLIARAPPVPGGTTWSDTVLATPVLAYVFLFIASTGSIGGEISGVGGNIRRSIGVYLGSNLFAMIASVAFWGLVVHVVSGPFFAAANHAALHPAGGPPVVPLATTFLLALTGSPIVRLWITVAFWVWFLAWPINNYVASTRFMFAMAFDGQLPHALVRVVGRTGTPIVALLVSLAGMIVCGYLYWYTSFAQLTLALPLFATVAFAGTCAAGALYPFRRATRAVYHASAVARLRIGRAPLITVLGTAGLIPLAFLIVAYMLDSRYGVNGASGLWFALALGAGALIVSLLWGRRRSSQHGESGPGGR